MNNNIQNIGGEFESAVKNKKLYQYLFLKSGSFTASGNSALKIVLSHLINKKINQIYLQFLYANQLLML